MEETVFLFFSKKQFASWKTENCGNCRNDSTGIPGCHLSVALADALLHEGVVPLSLAEQVGYFDIDDEELLVRSGAWTCREFRDKDVPWTRPFARDGWQPPRTTRGPSSGGAAPPHAVE